MFCLRRNKYWILRLVLTICIVMVRIGRRLRSRRTGERSILLLPPAAPGSLGDEAMITAVLEYLRESGANAIGLISYGAVPQWGWLDPAARSIILSPYFGAWGAKLRFALAVGRYKRFYFIGADVLDGYYSEIETLQRLDLVSIAARTGIIAAVISFSFNDRPTPASVQALRDLPASVRLYARDPISQERLSCYLKRPIELAADLAFLLRPDKDAETVSGVLNWIGEERANGRLIVGITANYLHSRIFRWRSLERFSQVYVDTLLELTFAEEDFSFVLIPHDHREDSDIVLAEAIESGLPQEVRSHCLKVSKACGAGEIKAICGELDLALSSRLHVAIACLGQGIPVACVTYQGKFDGMFKHFGLENMTIEAEQAIRPGNLVSFFLPLVEKRGELRKHIHSRLPYVQQLAQSNLCL